MRLTELANKYGTDKGTTAKQGHGYTPLYEMLLEPFRQRPINLCEIGLAIGGPELPTGSAERSVTDAPSIRMWHDYFPQAHIYGIDISDFSKFENDWFTFMRADCGNGAELDAIVNTGLQFDLIVEDASHASYHQQLTLCKLLPMVKPGGLFIIEDMNWQPSEYEKALPQVPRTDKLFAEFLETGRFTKTGAIGRELWEEAAKNIANIFMFDEEWLFDLRNNYNVRTGARPDMRHYQDTPRPARFLKKGYARRVAIDVKSATRTIVGDTSPLRRPRVKLAVVQKAWGRGE